MAIEEAVVEPDDDELTFGAAGEAVTEMLCVAVVWGVVAADVAAGTAVTGVLGEPGSEVEAVVGIVSPVPVVEFPVV